ncbi:DUF4336 domain-containing protein [Paraburkholderia megapolitana]|uniref:DUF4336 domain-containing protein n=1 Tax=Paraburkholderia megapolitana TaxID=420953 RepID=UPI0038BCDDAE
MNQIKTSELEKIAEDIWVSKAPHSFLGLHVDTRMTVIRLSSGKVLLHSPVPITPELRASIDAIGPVGHVVCPNLFHHVYAQQALTTYPDARLHGPEKLHRKRRDLRFDAVLSEEPDPDWRNDLVSISITGSLLKETVFYHPASKTLITSDLVENFKAHSHWLTLGYLKLNGMLGNVTWPPMMRVVYTNRRAARESVARILALPFERVVVAHGDVITDNARETLRKGLEWL